MGGTRRRLIGSMGLVLVAPALARAQAPRRIAYLASADPVKTPQFEGLREGLREHGFAEGKNIAIDYLWRPGVLPEDSALPLVRLNPELIFVWGTPALTAARKATSSIPIVFVGVGDPLGLGFVTSLARPGGNITGITNSARELAAKRLQLLSQLLPAHSRIAVLGRTVNPLARLELRDLEAAARALGLEIVFFDTTTPEDMGAAFAQAARQRVAAVLTLADPIFVSRRAQLAELEQRHRIPGIHPANEIVRAGGCMSYSVNGVEMFRRGARYVALILRGSAPGDLPVEQLTHFELWINLGRAKAIGLDVPPALLLRADRVIE